jgi:hypothetical protein
MELGSSGKQHDVRALVFGEMGFGHESIIWGEQIIYVLYFPDLDGDGQGASV